MKHAFKQQETTAEGQVPYCRLLIPQNSTIMFNCSKSFISSKLNWKEVLQQLQEAEIFLNKSHFIRTVFRFITSTDSLQFIHLKSAK